MSVSQPSREVVIIDVPEITDFAGDFHYEFFVPDEATNDTSGVPAKILARSSDAFDASFVDQSQTRIPRFVRFTWSPVGIDPFADVDTQRVRNNNMTTNSTPPGYIKDNLSKIMDESFYASDNYTSVNISDQDIDTKLFNEISGTAVFMNEDRAKFGVQSSKQLAAQTTSAVSDGVDFQFLAKYLVQPSEDNTFFYEQSGQRIRNTTVNALKGVNIHVQLNNRVIHELVKEAIVNPQSTFSADWLSMYTVSLTTQQNARNRSTTDMIHDDYKTVTDTVNLTKLDSTNSTTQAEARIVGYIIDRSEILQNGTQKALDPIVIENSKVGSTIDFRVKYYSTYRYTIRSIAEFTIPAIVESSNELVIAKLLISSKPSQPIQFEVHEEVPPPPPADFNSHWNFVERKLYLTWALPPNSQRDIKRFIVYRRASINEPFQMMRVFEFDDSEVKSPRLSAFTFAAGLVLHSDDPITLFSDPEFTKDSKFIYAVASLDAHGLISNYSEQYELSFDKFKNRLVKRRVSSSNAPQAYPNMYLNADTFVDSMLDNGHRTCTVAFTPDALSAFDSVRRDLRVLATTRVGGSYKLQFLNLDQQKEQVLNITLDDVRAFKDVDQKFTKAR